MKMLFGVLLFAFAIQNANAQFTPVTAKIESKTETIQDGKVIEKIVKVGEYCRFADGSILRHWTSVDGDTSKAKLFLGSFNDNRTLTVYRLDYSNNVAYIHGHLDAPNGWRYPPSPTPPKLPTAQVEGLTCYIGTIHEGGPLGPVVGHVCTTGVETNIHIWSDWTNTLPNGRSHHYSDRLFDIQVGVEMDRNFIDSFKKFAP